MHWGNSMMGFSFASRYCIHISFDPPRSYWRQAQRKRKLPFSYGKVPSCIALKIAAYASSELSPCAIYSPQHKSHSHVAFSVSTALFLYGLIGSGLFLVNAGSVEQRNEIIRWEGPALTLHSMSVLGLCRFNCLVPFKANHTSCCRLVDYTHSPVHLPE